MNTSISIYGIFSGITDATDPPNRFISVVTWRTALVFLWIPINTTYFCILNVAAEWISLLFRIQEVRIQISARIKVQVILRLVLRGFLQSLHTNAGIAPYIGPKPLPSISFLIHCSVMIPLFDGIVSTADGVAQRTTCLSRVEPPTVLQVGLHWATEHNWTLNTSQSVEITGRRFQREKCANVFGNEKATALGAKHLFVMAWRHTVVLSHRVTFHLQDA
jgi:hypothetical protein